MSSRPYRGRGRPFRRGGFVPRGVLNRGRGRGFFMKDYKEKRSRSRSRSRSKSRTERSRSPENKKTNLEDRLGPQVPDPAKVADINPDESIRITIGNDRYKDKNKDEAAKETSSKDSLEKNTKDNKNDRPSDKKGYPDKGRFGKDYKNDRDDPYNDPRDSKPPTRGRWNNNRGRGYYNQGRGGQAIKPRSLGPRPALTLSPRRSPRRRSYSRSPKRRSHSRSPGRNYDKGSRRSYSRSYSRSPSRRHRSRSPRPSHSRSPRRSRSPNRRGSVGQDNRNRSYSRSPKRARYSPSPSMLTQDKPPPGPVMSDKWLPIDSSKAPAAASKTSIQVQDTDDRGLYDSDRGPLPDQQNAPMHPDPKDMALYDDLVPMHKNSPKPTSNLGDVLGLPQVKKEGKPLFPIIAPSVMRHDEPARKSRDYENEQYPQRRGDYPSRHDYRDHSPPKQADVDMRQMGDSSKYQEPKQPKQREIRKDISAVTIPGLSEIKDVDDEDLFLYGDEGDSMSKKRAVDALSTTKLSVNPEPPVQRQIADDYGRGRASDSRSMSPRSRSPLREYGRSPIPRDGDSRSSFSETRRVMVAGHPDSRRSDSLDYPEYRRPDSQECHRKPDVTDYTRRPDSQERLRRPDSQEFARRPDSQEFARRPDSQEFARCPDSQEFARHPDSQEFARHPDSQEFARRPDSQDFARQPDSQEFARRPDNPEFARRPDSQEFMKRPDSQEFARHPGSHDFARHPGSQEFGRHPGSHDYDRRPEIEHPDRRYSSQERIDASRISLERDRTSLDQVSQSPEPQIEASPKPEEPSKEATIENILKSIGFNFELSKLMQEKAKKEREDLIKKNSLEAKIDKTSSFLQAGLRELGLAGEEKKEKAKKPKLDVKESYEERARRYREQQQRAYAEGHASPTPFEKEEKERMRKEREKAIETDTGATSQYGATYNQEGYAQYPGYTDPMYHGQEGYQDPYQSYDQYGNYAAQGPDPFSMDFPMPEAMQAIPSQRSNLKVIEPVMDVSPVKSVEKTSTVTSSTTRSSNRIVLLPKAEQQPIVEKKTIRIQRKEESVDTKVTVSQKEKEKLMREKEERQKQLKALEKELEHLRRQQNELMRKKQRMKDGHKDPLLLENNKLQQEIERQITVLRKAVDSGISMSKKADKNKPPRESSDEAKETIVPEEKVKEEKVIEKVKEEKKEERKVKLSVNYEYFDPGNHWCSHCNTILTNVYDYFNHVSSRKHKLKLDPYYRPWMPETLKNPTAKPKKAQTVVDSLKGVEFMMATDAFYCSICKVFAGDQACAEHHLKTREHNLQYQKYLDDNPFYEKSKNLEKAAKLSGQGLVEDNEKESKNDTEKERSWKDSDRDRYYEREKDYNREKDYVSGKDSDRDRDRDSRKDRTYRRGRESDYDSDRRDGRDSSRDRSYKDDYERDHRDSDRKRKYRGDSKEREPEEPPEDNEDDVETARGGVKVSLKPQTAQDKMNIMQKAGFGKNQIKNLQALRKHSEEEPDSSKISIKLSGKMIKTVNPLEGMSYKGVAMKHHPAAAPEKPLPFMIKKLKPLQPKPAMKAAFMKPAETLPSAVSFSKPSETPMFSKLPAKSSESSQPREKSPEPEKSPKREPEQAPLLGKAPAPTNSPAPMFDLSNIPVPEEVVDLRDPKEIEEMKLLGIDADYETVRAKPPPSMASSQVRPKTSMAATSASSLYNIFFPGSNTNPAAANKKEDDAGSEGSDVNLGEFEIIDECTNP